MNLPWLVIDLAVPLNHTVKLLVFHTMQFLSARSMLYFRVCFLATITFYSLKDPSVLLNSGFVILLGQALQLPTIQIDDINDPIFGLVALAFGSLALAELVPLFADNIEYFESIVPARLFTYFVLCIFSYVGNADFMCNNVVFVYSFFEIWFNFLIYNNLRDERYTRIKKLLQEASKRGEIDLDGLDQAQVDQVIREMLKRNQGQEHEHLHAPATKEE